MGLTKKQKDYWKKVKDSRCKCGALNSQHEGFQGHGGCKLTDCNKFRWSWNVDGKGEKID